METNEVVNGLWHCADLPNCYGCAEDEGEETCKWLRRDGECLFAIAAQIIDDWTKDSTIEELLKVADAMHGCKENHLCAECPLDCNPGTVQEHDPMDCMAHAAKYLLSACKMIKDLEYDVMAANAAMEECKEPKYDLIDYALDME